MLERLRGWFGAGAREPAARCGCSERAVCLLLIAAARADGEFSAAEARTIARSVSRHFDLPADETAELVALAAAGGAQDLFPATRLLNERLDRRERLDVLLLMWRVVYSDGLLEAREEALMLRAARLLDIPRQDLTTLKLRVRQEPADG